MISESNVKFTDSEVRMASRFSLSTQQEIEKLLENKDSMILSLEMHLTFLHLIVENLFITQLYIFRCLKINCDRCDNAFVVIFFNTMYNKTIIRFGFFDIRNNQGLGQCYQSQPSASADNTYLDLDYSGCHKKLIQ